MEQKIHTNSQLMWFTKLMPFDNVIVQEGCGEQAITDSWESDAELKVIITQLGSNSATSSQYTWMGYQLRRKGRLKSIRKDVKGFVQQCDKCQKNKADLAAYPGLSKYAHFMALKRPYTEQSVAKVFLDEVVRLHGLPETITSDRDAALLSSFWQELFTLQDVQLNTSTTYHPQSDGQTEVANICLETYLRAQLRMKQHADAYKTDRCFAVGDWVYLKIQPYRQTTLSSQTFHKLSAKYYGPFQVLKKVGPVAYTLLFPQSIKIHPRVHVSLLKKCYAVPDEITYSPTTDLANPH
ncbi:uncharacterized protein LOC132643911 [Lycium barbarum]|uniref:uncharacterized protein LOC132643911 n=1 Tax=Lycium barbarum TaxID=112863 RepID=UPI00293F31C6|nr:uncharacterized protein LOC132643911 [Lycium barbarum]